MREIMRHGLLSWALLLCVGGVGVSTSSAAAQQDGAVPMVTPIFSQMISYHVPKTFVAADDENKNGKYLQAFFPAGENLKTWTQSILLTGTKRSEGTSQLPPELITNFIEIHFVSTCPSTYSAIRYGEQKIIGAPAYAAVFSCGSRVVDSEIFSETRLVIAIVGADGYYTLERSERGPSTNAHRPIDAEKWRNLLVGFLPIKLCSRIDGEKPPYPSCFSHD